VKSAFPFVSAAHAAGLSDRHVQLLANHAVHKGDVHGGYVLSEAGAFALRSSASLPPTAGRSKRASLDLRTWQTVTSTTRVPAVEDAPFGLRAV
jgi:hypothetical protein